MVTPTPAPTPSGSYIAYTLWNKAADSIQKVAVGTPFEIRLVEGLSDHLSYSALFGNLPSTVQFIDEFKVNGTCTIKGVLETEGASEFAIEFNIRGGRKLMLNFRLIAEKTEEVVLDPFPVSRYFIPFSAYKTALLPSPAKRKEDA